MMTFLGVLAIFGSFAAVVFWARRVLRDLDEVQVRERERRLDQWAKLDCDRKAWTPASPPRTDATSSSSSAYDYGAAAYASESPSSDCSSSDGGGGGGCE